MPPHCDTLDGPVVNAARKAIETGDVNAVLPWVHEGGEAAVRDAFTTATRARRAGGDAAALADLWFFENVVRIHREGEGAAYTGLKPAGLDVGPVLPRAEAAIASGKAHELVSFLSHSVEEEIHKRLQRVRETTKFDPKDVNAARRHVDAVLDLELYSHHLYEFVRGGGGHGAGGSAEHEHAPPTSTHGHT